MDNFQLNSIQIISVWILPILFAVTTHEFAHGYVAYLFGDRTAQILGRLTFNPIKHIDIFGTVIVPIVSLLIGGVVLGWAKPVPINQRNFSNQRLGMILVSLAGPMTNFIMAILWALIAKLGTVLLILKTPGALAIYTMGGAGISINLMLMIINLLPIPPLDGGHIIANILPQSVGYRYEQIAPYGFFILLILFAIGVINIVVSPILGFLYTLITSWFGLR